MARRGRPRKANKQRYDNGRIKTTNYPDPSYVRGSDWVQAMQAKFGTHYNSALGRAYAAGLLGDGAEALNRYQAAKRFVSLYRRFIGGDFYRCALDDTPRGNVVDLNVDYDTNEKQRAWLMAAMDSMDVKGVRPYFDALVTSVNTDGGPFWLDHLLAGSTDSRDRIFLDAAIQALDIIAPEIRPLGILVSVA